jgi:hypothetical protein
MKMMYSKAIHGLMSDVRGTALSRLQALQFNELADLEKAQEILRQVDACECAAETAYKQISEILDAM